MLLKNLTNRLICSFETSITQTPICISIKLLFEFILPSVANSSPPLRHLRQVAMLPWRYNVEMGTATRYTLRRNTVSIMKGLVWFNVLTI